ncbi:transmembrane protein 198-like [Dendronephthya gigantea]|uniref:transmembrane protein 198-like n=1 Tax=Dendronephthya gigantea TaxID=151771 RepID=UPI00106B18D4|nr:transmembrane protein 198-like [Dendronephthya gigantea]
MLLPPHSRKLWKCLAIFLCTFGSSSLASQSSENITEIYKDDNSSSNDCQVFVMEKKLKGSDIGFATIAAVCIVAGFVLVFAGYRYLRTSLFVEAVAVAAFVTYTVCGYYTGLTFPGLLGVSLFIGVVFAVISVLVTIFGLFLSGFTMGFFTSLALIMAVSPLVEIPSKWIPFGILLGVGIICAVLILKFQKSLAIASTAMFGGVLVSVAADFFVEKFLLLNYAWKRITVESEGESCWFSWIILAIWPLFFVVGTIIQFRLTARHVDHKGKDDRTERFYGSEKAIKRYRNMNKSGDVVTTSWLRDKRKEPAEEGQDQLIEELEENTTNV